MAATGREASALKRRSVRVFAVLAVLPLVSAATLAITPRPAVAVFRYAFERDAERLSAALKKHVPAEIGARRGEHYDATDPDAYLDLFYPPELDRAGGARPTVVWTHGGGWISGRKEHVAGYAGVLAGKGLTVAAVDYSMAPRRTYPAPVRQLNVALAYLVKNAERLHVDPSRFFLAGDSAGAQIAAQLASAVVAPDYARAIGVEPSIQRAQLHGLVLYCGVYDFEGVRVDGPLGFFLKMALWSYTGEKDFAEDPRFGPASVVRHVTPEFPPVFLSAGNADPLLPQSRAFAAALRSQRVRLDALFFPDDHAPGVPHEYQFDLDTVEGRSALERSVAFLEAR